MIHLQNIKQTVQNIVLTFEQRVELLISDAVSVGFWNRKEGEEFKGKVINNEIDDEYFRLIEGEVYEVIQLLGG